MSNSTVKKILTNSYLKFFLIVFYLIFLVLESYKCYRQPAYNWDMLPYMAVIYSIDGQGKDVHAIIYQTAKKELHPTFYEQLVDSSIATKKATFQEPKQFYAQMPFYVVKPLYTYISFAFYKLGFPITKSTVIPSVLSYLGLGILLFFWLSKSTNYFASILLSTLIMLLPPILSTAKLSTPDFLAAFFVLLGLYLLIEHKKFVLGFTIIILSIYTRLDYIIFCMAFVVLLHFGYFINQKLTYSKTFTLFAICIASFFLVSYLAKSYGWSMLYYPSFSKHMNDENNVNKAFTIVSYFKLIKKTVLIRINSSYLPIFLLLIIIVVTKNIQEIKNRVMGYPALLGMSLIVIVTRFFLQPSVSDRFFLAIYIVALIALVKDYFGNNKMYNQSV